MKLYTIKIPLLFLCSSILWSSCKITKPYKKPDLVLTGQYHSPGGNDTLNMVQLNWSEVFADTLLKDLIHAGLNANLNLKIALERIEESRAGLKMSKAAFLPEITGNLSVRQSRLSFPQGFGLFRNSTQYDLGISSIWEMDIWGKLSSAKRSAVAGLLASEAGKRAVQTQLIADIANHYFDLLALDEQLTVTRKTAVNRAADAEAIRVLFENSIQNGVAVVQSEANYYEAELAIPDIEQKIRVTEHALSILLARMPGKIKRSALADQRLNYDLNPGVPAQLLANRPDVLQAEYQFREAFENTNISRANFYPALRITAGGGFSSFGLSNWFTNAGLFGNIAGGLAQPILNRGINKAELTKAQSRQQQTVYNFQLICLRASQEVSDALGAYHAASQKEIGRTKQLKALETAVEFNKELLNNSPQTNYTDVLAAEQNLLSAEMKSIDDKSQKLHAVVNLYRALGGGWR